MDKAADYLEADDNDDDDDDDDEKERDTDYKKRIKRQQDRQRSLKYIHCGIFDLLKDASRQGDDGINDVIQQIDAAELRHGQEASIMHNVEETMSEMEQDRIYHSR